MARATATGILEFLKIKNRSRSLHSSLHRRPMALGQLDYQSRRTRPDVPASFFFLYFQLPRANVSAPASRKMFTFLEIPDGSWFGRLLGPTTSLKVLTIDRVNRE